jgi:hypothetical protein
MTKNLLKTILAILLGISMIAIPYGIFILFIETIGPNSFHMNPHFIAILLGLALLGIGSYWTGKLLANFKVSAAMSPLIVLSAPGLYIGIAGFIINFIIDGGLAKDGLIALTSILFSTFAISAPFTMWGFKKNIKNLL